MFTSEDFSLLLPRFNDILTQYLYSPYKVTILSNELVIEDLILRLNVKLQSNDQQWIYKFIFAYDDGYQVPILYFQKFGESHGQQELVPGKQIFGELNTHLPITMDLISYDVGPWMFIHPCEVENTLNEFINLPTDKLEYLVTWNAIYGIGIFKELSVRYIQQ